MEADEELLPDEMLLADEMPLSADELPQSDKASLACGAGGRAVGGRGATAGRRAGGSRVRNSAARNWETGLGAFSPVPRTGILSSCSGLLADES